jgi:Leucine-rich repeat (LRR) protein
VLLASLAAQAATNYGFEVAGTTVTSDNCNNIVNNYITSGTVSYTPSNNTLIMYNVTINVTGTNNRVINNLENSGLTVMFRGTCNLKAQDASVIRIRKSTTLWAPQASDVVNINGVNDVGIWMATSNDFDLTIQGPGKFNISSTNNTAIEDEDDGSGTQLDTWHEVYFDNVNAVLSSGGNSVAKRVLLRFKAGSSVRFKATNNSSYPVINYCGWQLYGNETLLEPYGAYHDGSYVVDSNGNRVYNQDVYVSDDYVAIINATNFPDANFRSYVLGLYPKGYITQTDVNNRTRINIAQKNISNLKGIGYFTNLTSLYCNDNNLTSLSQLSGLSKMDELLCSDNQLTSLDLSYFPVLRYLNCSNNKLTTLNASNKSTLTQLYCQNNTLLTMLNCYSDNLTSLNVTGCTALKELRCYYNANLATITGLGDCTAITYLDCEDCAITNLSAVNSMTNIEKLYARNNKLTSLYVGELSYLNTLRVSGNTLLTTLYCYSCELTNLYVTGCSSLTYLDCSFNQLTSLDVTGCSALNHLEIYNNRINGTGMTTLVNSLPTRSASNKGVMYAVVSNDNNSMTSTQITIARNKYWLPYRYNGSTWVEMTASTRGDVDGNGNVNISDVTALIDYLLSGNASGINVSAADCDQNGAINISDVTALIDYLLSGHW